ncbi:ABC transporter permease [Myroides sp. M-43]|uniref:ABC transporter permease n=1 Tax=Myroides oncorhynchi TaxID=2893756 RepID=UPI001E3CDB94|nr:ABC transporter permease [Myroides oncorhynchi]MCC9042751.1 ABC transporter permease [Myroides oncorhynchi]
MMVYLRLLGTSFNFALNALRANKLRTTLSFLGVTIGIFSIIAVLAAVDSMDRNIKSELSGFDRNMIYVFNRSFGPTDIPKWKYEQYPKMKYDEYEYLKKNLASLEYASFNYFTKSEQVKYESNYAEIFVRPCSSDMQYLDNVKIVHGRFFNESESINGVPVVVIGHEVAQALFGESNPVGQIVRLYGKRFTVIGVIEKQGALSIGGSQDESAYMPVNIMRQMFGDNSLVTTTVVILKPNKNVDIKHFEEEIIAKLRIYRGLKESDENNFFVNVFGGMLDMIEKIIGQMNVVGWIISGFSLLVGGFGIANIMFVSVKERTHLIGIQKAIGAKSRFILFQFLFEAVVLAVLGGFVGILMVWGIGFLVTKFLDFEFVLSGYNILIGLGLSVFIGILSGYLPARSAALLDPVEAIRMGG